MDNENVVHIYNGILCVCAPVLTQLWSNLCDPILDSSLLVSFVHRIFQVRILEEVMRFLLGGSLSQPGIKPMYLASPADVENSHVDMGWDKRGQDKLG